MQNTCNGPKLRTLRNTRNESIYEYARTTSNACKGVSGYTRQYATPGVTDETILPYPLNLLRKQSAGLSHLPLIEGGQDLLDSRLLLRAFLSLSKQLSTRSAEHKALLLDWNALFGRQTLLYVLEELLRVLHQNLPMPHSLAPISLLCNN